MNIETLSVLSNSAFFLLGVLAGFILWGVDSSVSNTDDDEEDED